MYRSSARGTDPDRATRYRASPLSPASSPNHALVSFASPLAAEAPVAGLPAAARVVRALSQAGLAACWIEAGPGWIPSATLRAEVARLRGAMAVHFAADREAPPLAGAVLVLAGETLPGAARVRQALTAGATADACLFVADAGPGLRDRLPRDADDGAIRRRYAQQARQLLADTGKPTDGLVSRHINRPISRLCTALLLRVPGFRPMHATFGTAALAVAMFACLVLFGHAGLLAGAVLFQAASVFDGVDGEAARATFRSSERGAMFDSLVDAATNLLFVLGAVINMALRGDTRAADFGICGLLLLAAGLTIIGRRAHASAGPFTFDGVKDRLRARGTRLGQWLIWLTMRDFLALAAAVLVLLGLAAPALAAFSVVMAGWLAVVVATGARRAAALR